MAGTSPWQKHFFVEGFYPRNSCNTTSDRSAHVKKGREHQGTWTRQGWEWTLSASEHQLVAVLESPCAKTNTFRSWRGLKIYARFHYRLPEKKKAAHLALWQKKGLALIDSSQGLDDRRNCENSDRSSRWKTTSGPWKRSCHWAKQRRRRGKAYSKLFLFVPCRWLQEQQQQKHTKTVLFVSSVNFLFIWSMRDDCKMDHGSGLCFQRGSSIEPLWAELRQTHHVLPPVFSCGEPGWWLVYSSCFKHVAFNHPKLEKTKC